MKKETVNYVNNKKLYEAIVSYSKDPSDKISHEFIGGAIIRIVDNYINICKFNNYTEQWQDMMKSMAVLYSVRAINKFDANKSSNPFSYITQVVHHAFVQSIKDCKKHAAIEARCNIESHMNSNFENGFDPHYYNSNADRVALHLQSCGASIVDYEHSSKNQKKPKKRRKKTKPLKFD